MFHSGWAWHIWICVYCSTYVCLCVYQWHILSHYAASLPCFFPLEKSDQCGDSDCSASLLWLQMVGKASKIWMPQIFSQNKNIYTCSQNTCHTCFVYTCACLCKITLGFAGLVHWGPGVPKCHYSLHLFLDTAKELGFGFSTFAEIICKPLDCSQMCEELHQACKSPVVRIPHWGSPNKVSPPYTLWIGTNTNDIPTVEPSRWPGFKKGLNTDKENWRQRTE